ncbi:MAG TPA: hypothetical protein VEJ87_00050 [Acidimicrobiales bacterium]|nr:hypothetical protein [Acidimicrobiales bacterium]
MSSSVRSKSLPRRVRLSLEVRLERRKDSAYRRLTEDYLLPDGSRRVYFHHIRKTGGTSLQRSFLALGGEEPGDVLHRMAASRFNRTTSGKYAFAANQKTVLSQGFYFCGWSHVPAHAIELPPGTFTVSIFRDPLKRVLSYFNYLVAGDEPGTAFPVPERERRLAYAGFDDFLERVPKRDLLRQLFTFSQALDPEEAADRIRRCSFVFFNDSYEEGLADLAARLDLPLVIRHDRVTPKSVSPGSTQLERLRELLDPEYQLFRLLGRPVEAST